MAKSARALQNITLTLDEQAAAWLRMQAAKRAMSVSRLMGEFVHERMSQTQDYNEAMRQFLAVQPFEFSSFRDPAQPRAPLHDRAMLRGESQASGDEAGKSK